MALPDVAAVIQARLNSNGKWVTVEPNSTIYGGGGINFDVELRYAVVNMSEQPAKNFWWAGSLYRDGKKIGGVPAQTSTLPGWGATGKTVSDKEFAWKGENVTYEARLLADIGNFTKEENEQNNKATLRFRIQTEPW